MSPPRGPESPLWQLGPEALRHDTLFPGVQLSHNRVCGDRVAVSHGAFSHVLEINHCRGGRIGWDMRGGVSVYLGPGDLDVHPMDCCASSTMNLPLGYYEGMTLLVDTERLSREAPPLLGEAGLDPIALRRRLCPEGTPLSLPASPEIDHVFAPLYEELPERLRLPYERVKALELLLFLERLEPERAGRLDRYDSRQVETIREIHDLLISDLSRRHTIEELSQRFLMNTASLKAVFKAVYSQPIGAYMKEYRLRRAMELLRQTQDSIAEIARQVGYENQGKFTQAFKALTQLPPSEYRARAGLTGEIRTE